MVMVTYHYFETIWTIIITPIFHITYRMMKKYSAAESVYIHIQSLINIIQEDNLVITTKKR